jgi:hypothetical protein
MAARTFDDYASDALEHSKVIRWDGGARPLRSMRSSERVARDGVT